MYSKKAIILAALALSASAASAASAVSASIGVATTIGTLSVNQTVVSGSSSLSDGAELETTSVPTEVRLASGTDLRLATRSAGSFYSDHVLLDHGALRVGHFNGLTVNAAQLQISSDESGSQAIVRINKKTVEVASLGGAVNVMDSGMLTRVEAGTKMSFQQSGAQPAAQPATQTGAAAAPTKHIPGDVKTAYWIIGGLAVGGLVVGLLAANQGKSPFHGQ
jgi:ferric-dicitrate binding protein FerR (iron transport regulator)